MISAIGMRNFKCFKALDVSLGRLTLLTGFNAAGKSTTLQAVLLLSQTFRTSESLWELRLNGPLLHLGTPGDVINQEQSSPELELGITTDSAACTWQMRTDERDEKRIIRIAQIDLGGGIHLRQDAENYAFYVNFPEEARRIIESIRNVIYVSAVRKAETEVFPVPESPDPVHADVGAFGEFAPWWFHTYDDSIVKESRCIAANDVAGTLRAQVNAWLGELFPAAEVNAQPVPKTELMRLEFRTGQTGEWRRPSNTGYGLSYAFPILVAGLCALDNQILIIDSPEAHLHPRGQARLGRFLTQIAASGVQVIIETHSDHVLNGVRIALKENVIRPEDAAIYFFGHRPELADSTSNVLRLAIDNRGNLSQWPSGFFDQAEQDLATLAGWV